MICAKLFIILSMKVKNNYLRIETNLYTHVGLKSRELMYLLYNLA